MQELAVVNSDYGKPHVCKTAQEWAKNNNVLLSADKVGQTSYNQPIENFWAILKTEWLNKIPYNERSLERVQRELDLFNDYYLNKRRQKKLNYLTPKEFLELYNSNKK
ncbi:MAG: integrase core domain-containing protein [Mycoplasmataceae bacterium]|jgi:transposase InsO family protein|nr:integrase core domain-containing protein [Mycoplasmataceae bacterium]